MLARQRKPTTPMGSPAVATPQRSASASDPSEPELFVGKVPVPKPARSLLSIGPRVAVILWAIYAAYHIRTYAIVEYGPVIHEFDPWFNFRATQYLAKNGWNAFSKWFDYMSWYPLRRPVGTTIYPG